MSHRLWIMENNRKYKMNDKAYEILAKTIIGVYVKYAKYDGVRL